MQRERRVKLTYMYLVCGSVKFGSASSTFTVALPETKWVGGGLILGRDQKPIAASAVFYQRVDYFQT